MKPGFFEVKILDKDGNLKKIISPKEIKKSFWDSRDGGWSHRNKRKKKTE